jgi:nitroimidazol reductase NimA-like FMN-containing flavoprotein (pyridoxamine 5'-phosphate oxidase superfamily)
MSSGLPVTPRSAWAADRIAAYLAQQRTPLRLSVMHRDAPLICSLWYVYENGRLWCATQAQALVTRAVGTEAACGFEVANNDPPYRGVRGQGRVRVHEQGGLDMLERLVGRYLGATDTRFAQWLLNRDQPEVALSVEPEWITAWDYGARMRDAVGTD